MLAGIAESWLRPGSFEGPSFVHRSLWTPSWTGTIGPRAELFAVCEALRISLKPVHVRTDHLNIITGIESGEKITTTPRHPNADLWKTFWHRIRDHGGLDGDLTIEWVKGHNTADTIDALGNRWADSMAKLGAESHAVADDILLKASQLRRKLTSVLKRIGRAAALHLRPCMPPTRSPKAEWPKRSAAERRAFHLEGELAVGEFHLISF